MADRKSDTMQKLVQSAMRRPGMKERLAQVVPIVKAMTPAQRLALAGMVMGKGGQSMNLNNKVLNAQLLLPISQDIATMLRHNGAGGDSSARASSGYGVSYVRDFHRLKSRKRKKDVARQFVFENSKNSHYAVRLFNFYKNILR